MSKAACILTTQPLMRILRSREAAASVNIKTWPTIIDTGAEHLFTLDQLRSIRHDVKSGIVYFTAFRTHFWESTVLVQILETRNVFLFWPQDVLFS